MVANRADEDVQVVFFLETRDLFRVAMDVSKWRLFVGLAVSLALVSVLIGLFLWLDEKTILLQTSPLFVGLPILSVGGQVLRLHAACRKYVTSLAQGQRRFQYTFPADHDGFDVISGKSFHYVSWDDVFKVVEKPKYFQVFLSRFDVRAIPKRGMSDAETASLRKLFVSRLGSRAKF